MNLQVSHQDFLVGNIMKVSSPAAQGGGGGVARGSAEGPNKCRKFVGAGMEVTQMSRNKRRDATGKTGGQKQT